jgi:uncharacterized Tic20 family protein
MDDLDRDKQANQWAMFLHFSLLAGFMVPYAGLIAPIVIWQIKKEEFPEINIHGKIVVNWIISTLIYGLGLVAIYLVVIGFFSVLLRGADSFFLFAYSYPIIILISVVFGILNVIFPIIGRIKANNGVVWKYPLSLRILQ